MKVGLVCIPTNPDLLMPSSSIATAPTGRDLRLALEDETTYPYSPEHIEVVQTHISYVALAPPYVYKIKKSVDLGFLDFSTIEKRRHFCEEEIRLNGRLCGDIYEGVVPISATPNGLRLEDDSNIVDVAVKMRMLNPDQFMDARLRADRLEKTDIDRVVTTLADFYRERPSSPAIAENGRIPNIWTNIRENFDQAVPHRGDLITRPAYEALKYAAERFMDQHAGLLHRRRAEGRIVDGHGDLRLEHVHLSNERVCIYDCIEFTTRFRHIDIASDVAFLAMELDVNGKHDLARYFMEAMAEALDDPDLLRVADFYKSYRAFVRGKVNGMKLDDDDITGEARTACIRDSRHFYQWALRYMAAGSRPLVVVVMGRAGTGKSTQAQALHDALSWPVVSSDITRKQLADIPLHERPDAETRAALYSTEMTERTYTTLRESAIDHAKQGQGTILDATFSRKTQRDALRTHLAEHNIPHVLVELTAPDDALKQRLGERSAQDHVVSDARAEDFEMLTARYEAPDALEDAHHVRVKAEGMPDSTTRSILKHLVRLKPNG